MSVFDQLTCHRCQKPGTFVVTHSKIGGAVCEFCWTPADEAVVYPQAAERRARWNAALAAVGKKHPESKCEALKDEQRIACPRHDRDDDDSEKE